MNTDILRKAVVPTVVGVAGLSVGGVLGYIVGLRRGERQAIRRQVRLVNDDTELMRRYNEYDFRETGAVVDAAPLEKLFDVRETGKVPYYTPPETWSNESKDRLIKDIMVQGPVELVEPVTDVDADVLDMEEEDKRQNAFDHPYDVADDTWDWERELNERSTKPIYPITTEEFRQGEMGFRQSALIFYEGDRMVTDELGEPLYNWTSHIGTELPFGHGTGDENILFVRNESLRWEYEVQRDPGRFDVEVQAHDIQVAYDTDDLKHMHRPLKMRRE